MRFRFSIRKLGRIAQAFIKRDMLLEISYRFSFFLQVFQIFLTVVVFHFVARLLGGETVSKYLAPYGGNYFSFAIIDIAFFGYYSVGFSSFSRNLRQAQTTGTLEAMLTSPSGISTIVICSSLWSFIMATLRVMVYLVLGALFIKPGIVQGNYLCAFLILALTVISASSLGILSASFIIVLKRGDPVNWLFNSLSTLLGGVYFPISVLPEWMQLFSHLLPTTYALRAMRLALLQGAPVKALAPDIVALGVFSVSLLPMSLLAFRYAVRRARIDGSLTHY
jgi:ABC-2 type transport system permease protein